MKKYLNHSLINPIRQKLRNIPFFVNLYQRYFTDLPRDLDKPEKLITPTQNKILAALEIKSSPLTILLTLNDYNDVTDYSVIKETIKSVLLQSYQNWLVIVPEHVHKEVEGMDERIVIQSHISSVDDMYIGEVYAGDCLHPHALKAFVHYIQSGTDLIYCDHDVINKSGKYNTPQYKSQWNSELAYSTFYMGCLTLYRLSLFNELSHWLQFKSHYQRLLYLREVSLLNVQHIALTLYHQLNTPLNLTDESDILAVNTHLAKQGVIAEKGLIEGSYKLNWPLPEIAPLVSIIIPTKNGKELVKQCIDTLYDKTLYTNFEVLLVDNQSDDQLALSYFNELVAEKKVRLLKYDAKFNYSAINNFAVKQAKGELLVLLNNDVEVISSLWLTEMVAQLMRPSIGCVGAKLYYANDTVQHAGVIVGLGRCAGHSHKLYQRSDDGYMQRLKLVQNYTAVTAACLGVRKSVYNKVNGLNERSLAVAYNDVDFCLKVKAAGFDNIWSPYIELYHHESVSRPCDYQLEEHQRYLSEVEYMQRTWQVDNYIDPAYSPWLTMISEDFSEQFPTYFYVN
ncbi:glycosyltransferase family 2 protein [Psychromonas aquatilis]|uniref:Glycosyltransferase family 2 protein n=1 Tax=Psychromonas aquatilis TaxID=2005072 RepID=A0ABU9GT23_9GAMM